MSEELNLDINKSYEAAVLRSKKIEEDFELVLDKI